MGFYLKPWQMRAVVSVVRVVPGFPNGFDFKNNEEAEGADLSSLFDEPNVVPIKVPSKLPKDLLPLVNDCGIILV